MHRRQMLLAAAATTAAVAASPTKSKAAASQRIPLCEYRYPQGDTACYEAASETDPIDGLTATDAEFIPTGEYRVFVVKTPEARTLTDPLALPLQFGTAGDAVGLGSQMADRGQRMNRSEAVAAMMLHNRGIIGRGGDQWAVAVEYGEAQGMTQHCIEVGDGEFAMAVVSEFRPCRVIGRS